eukprot:gene31757-6387_t
MRDYHQELMTATQNCRPPCMQGTPPNAAHGELLLAALHRPRPWLVRARPAAQPRDRTREA